MSLANLTRYENLLIGDLSDEREMIECASGSYVKFDEAMEASSNSVQQLNDAISAMLNSWDSSNKTAFLDKFVLEHLPKLRKLLSV